MSTVADRMFARCATAARRLYGGGQTDPVEAPPGVVFVELTPPLAPGGEGGSGAGALADAVGSMWDKYFSAGDTLEAAIERGLLAAEIKLQNLQLGGSVLAGPDKRRFVLESEQVDGAAVLGLRELVSGPRLQCEENGKVYQLGVTAEGGIELVESRFAGGVAMKAVTVSGGTVFVRVVLVDGVPTLQVT